MKKYFLISIILLSLFFWFKNAWEVLNYFQVIFFDVGQGDATLIVTPAKRNILIDGGPDKSVLRGLGEVLSFWNRKIDLLIVTHAHDDHFVGLIEVVRRYRVKSVLINRSEVSSDSWQTLEEALKELGVKIVYPREGLFFNFDNSCYLSVLSAHNKIRNDENDYSIISKFYCLGKNVLLAGDATKVVESELLNKKINLKADIFKVSHHGSQTSNTKEFILAISPQIGVISVGADNKFGHPNQNVIDNLRAFSVDIYQTAKSGLLHFLANNKEIILVK